MTARHTVRPAGPVRPGRGPWRLSPGPDEIGWKVVAGVVVSGVVVSAAGATLLSGLLDPLVPDRARAGLGMAVGGLDLSGLTAVLLAGWVLVLAGAAGPTSWLGARLVEALVALESSRAFVRRLRRELDAQDDQLARLAERLAAAAGAQARGAAELAQAHWAFEQARADLGHAQDELRDLRQSLDIARLDLATAIGSRDDALAAVDEAVRQAQASGEVARQAEHALALVVQGRDAGEHDDLADVDDTSGDDVVNPADVPVVPAWDREPGTGRLAGFASVDLQVFDAFVEADLDDSLDASARKGKHSARPVLDTSDVPAAQEAGVSGTRVGEAAPPESESARDVA